MEPGNIRKADTLEQRMTVLTIGADDLSAMRTFYEKTLGWKPVAQNKDVVFYKLNGFLFSICGKKMLADFIGVKSEGTGFRAVTIGYNVNSEEEVRAHYEKLKDKVKILKQPTAPPFGGLFFYFTDIEGNILEIAFNPYVVMDESNNVTDHKSIDNL